MTPNDIEYPYHTYQVTYKILHTREFHVKSIEQIHDILNEHNDVEVIDIVEIDNTGATTS